MSKTGNRHGLSPNQDRTTLNLRNPEPAANYLLIPQYFASKCLRLKILPSPTLSHTYNSFKTTILPTTEKKNGNRIPSSPTV